MIQPAWNDPGLDAGVMVKGALWLIQDVGAGNVFTKSDIRAAFPGISQADRRIRDLRDYGWVLHANTQDASLMQEQTRFVEAGAEVWDPRSRRAANPKKGISAKVREQVMARDGYLCSSCGIAGGEDYADDPAQTGVLSVRRQDLRWLDGSSQVAMITLCKRCTSGQSASSFSIPNVIEAVGDLSDSQLRDLRDWMRDGRRSISAVERAWALYLRLPPEGRTEVRTQLGV